MMRNDTQNTAADRFGAIATRLEDLPLDRLEKQHALACVALGERLAAALMSAARAARRGCAALAGSGSHAQPTH
jgi:hypothetical protein